MIVSNVLHEVVTIVRSVAERSVVVNGDIPGSALNGDNLGALKVVFNHVS